MRPVLDPEPDGAARVVAGDRVHPGADELSHQQAALDRGDDILGAVRPGRQVEVGRRRGRNVADPARGVARGFEPESTGGVGVEEIAREASVVDDHGATSRQTLGVERTRAEAADEASVVDDRDLRRGDACRRGDRAGTTCRDRGSGRRRRRRDGRCSDAATSGSKTTGASCVGTRRAARRRSVRSAARRPTLSGSSSRSRWRALRVPVVALHTASVGGDRRHTQVEARAAVAAVEAEGGGIADDRGVLRRTPRPGSC